MARGRPDRRGCRRRRVVQIRDASPTEAAALEQLQRRSSDIWVQYREQLAAHPEAIELPRRFIDDGWVRVAADDDDTPLGFSVVIPGSPGHSADHELDGLFVEPRAMRGGIGRALVEDACGRARTAGARELWVTAGPAQRFYEQAGFDLVSTAQTRFGPAVRMRRDL
jgi:GNAT superfamily N-acetyltransferase